MKWLACLGTVMLLATTPAAAEPSADFVFVDLRAKTIRAADLRGKWVIVNFWAPWCPPCWGELPEIDRLARERRDVAAIAVAMDYGGNAGAVRNWVSRLDVAMPVVLGGARSDTRNGAAQIGEVSMYPTTFVFKPDGRLATRIVGPTSREALLRIIDP